MRYINNERASIPKTRVAVLVSEDDSALMSLIVAQSEGELRDGIVVCAISSNPDAKAIDAAVRAQIPTYLANRASYADSEGFESYIKEILTEHRVELVVLAGFKPILSADFIACYPKKIICVHPSLMPAFSGKGYFGMKAIEAAIERGVKITGATVYYVEGELGEGEIIKQKAVTRISNESAESLRQRIRRTAEQHILSGAVEELCVDIRKGKRSKK